MAERSGIGSGVPTLGPMLIIVFIGALGFSIVLPFLVFLVIRLGGNAFLYGIIGATYSAFQLVGAPVLGRWSDTRGRKRILLLSQLGTFVAWCLFLVALALPVFTLVGVDTRLTGAFTLTVPLVVLFVACALDGLTGGNVSVANAYVADVTPEPERARAFGRMAVAQNLGFIAGPAIAGVLAATRWGEALPVLAAAAVSGLGLAIIALRLPESSPCVWVDRHDTRSVRRIMGQEQRDCHEVQGSKRPSLQSVLADAPIARLLAIQFLVYLAFNFFYIALPVHAATALAWSVRDVGLFLSFLSVIMVLVQGPLLGRLSRTVADRTLALVGGIVLAFSFYLFAFEATPVLMLGGALLALGNGLMWPSLVSLLSKAAGSAQGAVQGIAGSSGAVASILGLIVGGLAYNRLGMTVFILAAVITLVAWLMTFRVRREPVAIGAA